MSKKTTKEASVVAPEVLASLENIDKSILCKDFNNVIYVGVDKVQGTVTFSIFSGSYAAREEMDQPSLLDVVRRIKTLLTEEKEAIRASFNAVMDPSTVAWKKSIQENYIAKINSFKDDIVKLENMEDKIMSQIHCAQLILDEARDALSAMAHEVASVE